jgi:hypothetical protein
MSDVTESRAARGVSRHADMDEHRNLHLCLAMSKRTHDATDALHTMLSTWSAGPQEDGRLILLGAMTMSPPLDIRGHAPRG